MERPRYKETGKETFFGNFIYERVVPKQHFLQKLDEMIDGEIFCRINLDEKASDHSTNYLGFSTK